MKKYLGIALLIAAVLFGSLVAFSSCEPAAAPGAEPSSLVPTSNNTYSLGTSTKTWKSLFVSDNVNVGNYVMTFPSSAQTIVGRTTTDTLTNKTLTSPTVTTPTITGTSVIANHASGNTTMAAGVSSLVVTHGLGSAPTRVFWSFNGAYPGTAADATAVNPMYWGTATSTNFTITAVTSTNVSVGVNWLAYIADE